MTEVERIEKIESMVLELESAGIRINKAPPNVLIDKKAGGGLTIHTNLKQNLDKETIKDVAGEFGIKNGDITIKEKLTMETLVDAFSTSRAYIPSLFVINKVDLGIKNFNDVLRGPKSTVSSSERGRHMSVQFLSRPEVGGFLESSYELIHQSKPILISAERGEGLEELKEKIWEALKLVKVYLVKPDDKPNLESPIILKAEQTLKDVAEKIGTEFAENKKLAKIWGPGAHYPGQEVSLTLPIKERMQVRFI